MNVYIPYTRLPSAYQEVEYIQSSGTQYIKIGTSFKTSYKTVIDFQMTVTGGDYVPIGVRTADGGNKRYGIDVWNSYFKVIAGGGDWNNTIAEDTNRHTITLDKSTAIVDGTSYSVQYADWTFNEGIGVFYYHKIGETPYVDAISSNKLYKLDIYDENGTHIYDLVPCYRKSDNVIGLYDLVNNQFYTNAGTGTFSKGNDVTMSELKNDYIGEFVPYTPGANTLLYVPMKEDFNDHSGNNWTLTNYNTTIVTTTGGISCGLFTGSDYITTNVTPQSSYNMTYSVWTMLYEQITGENFIICGNPASTFSGEYISFNKDGANFVGIVNSQYYNYVSAKESVNTGTRYHICYANKKMYINGVLGGTMSYPGSTYTAGYSYIIGRQNTGYASYRGYISELIVENGEWTAQEVQDYFNNTKSNYGL